MHFSTTVSPLSVILDRNLYHYIKPQLSFETIEDPDQIRCGQITPDLVSQTTASIDSQDLLGLGLVTPEEENTHKNPLQLAL